MEFNGMEHVTVIEGRDESEGGGGARFAWAFRSANAIGQFMDGVQAAGDMTVRRVPYGDRLVERDTWLVVPVGCNVLAYGDEDEAMEACVEGQCVVRVSELLETSVLDEAF